MSKLDKIGFPILFYYFYRPNLKKNMAYDYRIKDQHAVYFITSAVHQYAGFFLDKITPYLANALVTSYLYIPFIGISKITIPNLLKTHYSYSGLNRLKEVRDTEGKLIKSNTYNYKTGQ